MNKLFSSSLFIICFAVLGAVILFSGLNSKILKKKQNELIPQKQKEIMQISQLPIDSLKNSVIELREKVNALNLKKEDFVVADSANSEERFHDLLEKIMNIAMKSNLVLTRSSQESSKSQLSCNFIYAGKFNAILHFLTQLTQFSEKFNLERLSIKPENHYLKFEFTISSPILSETSTTEIN